MQVEIIFNNFMGSNFTNNFFSNFRSSSNSNTFPSGANFFFFQNINVMNQPQGTPPASEDLINLLCKIKMNEKYCKRNQPNTDLEYPTCSVCLVDTAKNEECFLLPCGHIFHIQCIEKWLKMHNNCPVCRFELTVDKIKKFNKEQQDDIIIEPMENKNDGFTNVKQAIENDSRAS